MATKKETINNWQGRARQGPFGALEDIVGNRYFIHRAAWLLYRDAIEAGDLWTALIAAAGLQGFR